MHASGHSLRRAAGLSVSGGVMVGVLALALLVGAGGTPDRASGQSRALIELGRVGTPAFPNCPDRPCEAIGNVTGFQVRIGGSGRTQNPFRVPANGRIVAWSITLAEPRPSQVRFFNRFYGEPPKARIAILKQKRGDEPRFRLIRQSPAVNLTPYLGTRPIFTLHNPLAVSPGQIVAITFPTWAPAFAVNRSPENRWLASRKEGKCAGRTDIKRSRPHQGQGSVRRYDCSYGTARIVYTAFLARTSTGGGNQGGGGGN
jgi:hypothetical protein